MNMSLGTNFLKIVLFIFILAINNNYYCQKAKIEKIIDSNLFELYDGSLIKIANLDVPNINHPNVKLRKVGQDAFEYAKRVILKRSYELSYPEPIQADTNYKLVYIIKDYPLELRNYTQTFLQRGYGKYIQNTVNEKRDRYILAETEAKEDFKGVWQFNISKADTLDRGFMGEELITEEVLDSMSSSMWGSMFSGISNEGRVLLEFVAAPIVGIPVALLSGLGVAVLTGPSGHGTENLGFTLIGGYIGYALGNAAGVYLIAKNGEKEISFGETFLASAFGGALGIASLFMHDEIFIDGESQVILLLSLPALAAIVYANIIAEDKVDYKYHSYNYKNPSIQNNNILSHQDLYNSKKLFEIDIFRINF